MPRRGTKRKRDHELSDSSRESPLTDMEIMSKAKQIMKRVTDNLVHTVIMHGDIMSKINKMNNVIRKKATIGIFGKTGEGKSSLLSVVLGEKDLLPSGCYGACTVVVTQVEANLTDSNYTAEIELFSKEEWEEELKYLFTVLSEARSEDCEDCEEDQNDDLITAAEEKITALYGADADKKTFEELKKDAKFAKIETFLSTSENPKTISKSDVTEFSNDVACYILHSQSSPGGWYWPLVKSVTIKIPGCHELLEHIVLVDIPGTGDCNKTRNDLWKSKLTECSSVWIVSDIKRATTDKDPWGILKHCTEELGPGGECKTINFICTKTDDINPSAYIRCERLTLDQNAEDKTKDRRGFHKTLQALCKNHGCFMPRKMDQDLDLNKKLVKPLHESIDEDFNLIFPVSGKTGRSVQEQIDKFSIIDSANPGPPTLHHIQNFIKIEETKLKASLNREIVEKKKDIHLSIKKTIEDEMTSCYDKAAKMHGKKSMQKRQELLITTVDKIKQDMFNKAKMKVLKEVNNLKLYIKDALESGLKRSMEMSLSKNSKIRIMDVSKEAEQLESLSEQLSE